MFGPPSTKPGCLTMTTNARYTAINKGVLLMIQLPTISRPLNLCTSSMKVRSATQMRQPIQSIKPRCLWRPRQSEQANCRLTILTRMRSGCKYLPPTQPANSREFIAQTGRFYQVQAKNIILRYPNRIQAQIMRTIVLTRKRRQTRAAIYNSTRKA